MKKLYIHKAEPLTRATVKNDFFELMPALEQTVESVTIIIHDKLVPDAGLSVEEVNHIFENDAHELFKILLGALPGGTLRLLSERMSNHYTAKEL